MATLVKSLCVAGLINRGDGSKRKTGLWLTPNGVKKIDEIAEVATPIEDQHTSDLTFAEKRTLRHLLAKVYLRGLRLKLSQQECVRVF